MFSSDKPIVGGGKSHALGSIIETFFQATTVDSNVTSYEQYRFRTEVFTQASIVALLFLFSVLASVHLWTIRWQINEGGTEKE